MNSETAILSIRFAIKHALLHCLLTRILVLDKKNSRFLGKEFLKLRFFSTYSGMMHSCQRNTLLFNLVARTFDPF